MHVTASNKSLSLTTLTYLCPDMPQNHMTYVRETWSLDQLRHKCKNNNATAIITNNNYVDTVLNILLKIHRVWQLFQI